MKKIWLIVVLILLTFGCANPVRYNHPDYIVTCYTEEELEITQEAIKRTHEIFKKYGFEIQNFHDVNWVYRIKTDIKISNGTIVGLYVRSTDTIYIKRFFKKWGTPEQRKLAMVAHEVTHDILHGININNWNTHEYICSLIEISMYPEDVREKILKSDYYEIKDFNDITVEKYKEHGMKWQIGCYKHHIKTNGSFIKEIVKINS